MRTTIPSLARAVDDNPLAQLCRPRSAGVNLGDAALGSSPVAAASADPFRDASTPGPAWIHEAS
jgi:hypothetical protein